MRRGGWSSAWRELARIQAETVGRLHTMGDMLSGRQAELARALNERLDAVTHRVGQSMRDDRRATPWKTCAGCTSGSP